MVFLSEEDDAEIGVEVDEVGDLRGVRSQPMRTLRPTDVKVNESEHRLPEEQRGGHAQRQC